MAISQPEYPVSTAGLVEHVGSYVDEVASDSHWRAPVATKADLPAAGNTLGDTRLVVTDESIGGALAIYGWDGSAWQLAAGGGGGLSMSILSGSAAPDNTTGGDGDYYLRATGAELLIYGPKASGTWPAGVSLLKRATFQDEASDLALRDRVNFTGAGVTATDNSGAGRTDVTIPGLALQDEGSPLTARAALNFKGAGVQAVDNSGAGSTDVTISGQLYQAVTDTPEAHGAKRDGRMVTDAAITSGTNVLTSATAGFTSADVGKAIHVRNAATGTNVGLTTTIAGFTNSTTVTLTANATATVSGQVAVYGTDDTAAWKAAVSSAVTACQADGSNYCEIIGSNGIYMIAGAPTLGGATRGNAQIPLPAIQPNVAGVQKVTVRLGGAHDSATVAHWDQMLPQMSGCVLFSTLMGQTSDATYGLPSVIGGPSIDWTGPTEVFSNMKLILDGLYIVTPYNPSYVGVDARRLAQCDVLNLTCQGLATPDADGGTPNFSTKPTNSNSVGLYMPRMNNNDSANIGVYHCEGFYYGLGFSDHLTAQKLLIVYCDTAMWVNNPSSSPQHGAAILYASVEACNRVLDTGGSAGGAYPLVIDQLDVEIIAGPYDINDANSSFRGYIGFVDPPGKRAPRVNGGKHLKVEDLMAARGALSGTTYPLAPGLPKSGGGTTNITSVSQASPAVVTATAHGLTTGQVIHISALSGPQVDVVNGQQTVTVIDANTFSIPVNTTTKAYSSGGGVVNHAYVPWRDALVCISGGTVTAVTIDGTATGLTSGAFVVPVGKKLELTYSVAPTMNVTLL